MKIQVLLIFLVLCLAKAEPKEYESEDYSEDHSETKAPAKAEKKDSAPKMIVEDEKTEKSSLVEMDYQKQQLAKGFCQWEYNTWYKPGYAVRCSCMKCICRKGNWDCAYHFAYCPYYYCGNVIYNPQSQLCCCGKVYTKRRAFSCCGYFYYNTRTSKCCNYYTVKPRRVNCPRYQIGPITKG